MKKNITSGYEIDPETKDDNIYYNLSIVNNSTRPVNVSFNQTLGNSIIDKPEEYYLSCIRFALDTAALPIFIFKNGAYTVSINYNGVTHTEVVPFIMASSGVEDYPNAIYSYQDFIDMINVALSAAYADFGGTLPMAASEAPYLYFDPKANGLISLFAQTAYDSTAVNPISIWFNRSLYYVFDNFLYYLNFSNLALPIGFQIIVKSLGNGQNTSAYDSSIPTGHYKMSQEYVAVNRWRGPQSLSFISYNTGVRDEYTSGANNSTTLNTTQTAGFGPPTIKQWTDFVPILPANDLAGWRGNLVYNPSSQYRLVDLLGNKVNNIDLTLVWYDIDGNSYPFEILGGTQASIKLLFAKKSLFKNYKKQ
jgi:hypothetical protein